MDRPLLHDANTYPVDTILNAILGNCSAVYQTFVHTLPEYQIELEWRYYDDGKSWLGKAVSKKKTIFWLSVWQNFFKVSFHFTEKTCIGIINLPIVDEIKTSMVNAPIKGKLISLIIDVSETAHLKDVFTLISYKQSCK